MGKRGKRARHDERRRANPKAEAPNPKSEIRNPKEIRRPKSEEEGFAIGFRISDFEPSFGFRISGLRISASPFAAVSLIRTRINGLSWPGGLCINRGHEFCRD